MLRTMGLRRGLSKISPKTTTTTTLLSRLHFFNSIKEDAKREIELIEKKVLANLHITTLTLNVFIYSGKNWFDYPKCIEQLLKIVDFSILLTLLHRPMCIEYETIDWSGMTKNGFSRTFFMKFTQNHFKHPAWIQNHLTVEWLSLFNCL